MSTTIVVGGQYGSEGKGKVVALLAARSASPTLVRCGGPNSGHTVRINGEDLVLRQVPSCMEPQAATFYLAAGCTIDEDVLFGEIDALKIPRERIVVDSRAVLVEDQDRDAERRELRNIASTCSGTGAASVRRMSRRQDVRLAGNSQSLRKRCRVETVAPLLHHALADGRDVIIEGTQGFGLSLLHGPDYPFVTSRDTTAAGFAAETGISPRAVDKIVMVIRTFPIRVGGPSGPLASEISWEEIAQESRAPHVTPEFTSVTKRLRRVARFDFAAVKVACEYNQPTSLAVMGLDRIDYSNTSASEFADLTPRARAFLERIEREMGVPVEFAGTGFGTQDAIAVQKTRPECNACLIST